MRDHWDAVWDTKTEDSVSWFEAEPNASLQLLESVIMPSTRVVDVGGGASRLVDHLLECGVDVTVADLASSALDRARHRLGDRAGEVRWIEADVRELTGVSVDVWHDRAVFHFLIDEADRSRYVAAARAAVRPGGHLVVGGFADDGPDSCSGLPVRRHNEEQLAAAFEIGFIPDHFQRVEHVTPWGDAQCFLYGRFVRVSDAFTNERSFG